MTKFIHKLKKLNLKIKHDDVFAWASMLTIYLLLSLFPIIILVTDTVTRLSLNDPEITKYLINMLPSPVFEAIDAISVDVQVNQSASVIPTAAIIAFWSASRGVLALIKALNKAYEVEETRNYFLLKGLALVYTLGFLILILSTLLLVVFGNNIYNFVDLNVNLPTLLDPIFMIFRFALPFAISMLFFLFLYNLPPTVQIGIKKVLPGAIISSMGLIGTSSAFSLYVKYSKSLSYLYGSLTGVMILVIWLFLISVIIMIGGEINAVFSLDNE